MIDKIETDKRQHIFHKGSSFTSTGAPKDSMFNPNGGTITVNQNNPLPFPNISPGVFIKEKSNTLIIFKILIIIY